MSVSQFLQGSPVLLLSRQHCITQNDVQNKLQRSPVPLCNFLLTPALPKTLRVIKLILRGRKLPSLIRKLQQLSDLFAAVKSQGDCVQGKGLFTSVGSNFTNHSFWQWPPGLRLNPDTLLAGSQGPSHRQAGGSREPQS